MTSEPPPPTRAAPVTLIALAAGVLGAVQPKINAVLGARVGSSVLAALVNFSAAFAGVVVMLAVRRQTRERLLRIRQWPVPRWTFTAGLGGVFVVLAGALTVETIGVAVFSIAFFGGQLSTGLVVDRLGIGAGGKRPIAATRVQAAALALTAVAVSQVGRPIGDVEPAAVALVVLAGAASAFQSAFNGRVASAVGDPFAPTAVNVTVGLSALVVLVTVQAGSGAFGTVDWPSEPWLYAGGFLGVSIVLALAIASAAIGVLTATISMLAAQLTAAFVVDGVVEGEPPTVGALAGSALIVLAVVLVGRSGRPVRQAQPPA